MMKICKKCGEEKPFEDFHKQTAIERLEAAIEYLRKENSE